MNLILLRHGESEWNKLNKFTGWTDVALTKAGEQEATYAANQILEENYQIDTLYTSLLKRAVDTAHIVANINNFPKKLIKFDWRLNERHYGALQGLNKSETAEKYGEDQVHIWRRSFSTPPPLIDIEDKRHPRFCKQFSSISNSLPCGESLKDVIDRLVPFWDNYYSEIKKNSSDHLIVAHSNSLRAIIKILDKLSDKDIMSVNIPTGIPLVYSFDSKFNIENKRYLADNKTVRKQQEIIKKQGKRNG